MAKFTFNLDGVLRQREHVEQERQRDFAIVQKELTQLQAELRELDGVQQAATEDLRNNRLVGHVDLSFLAAHRRFMFAMQRKGMGIVQRIALAQRKVDEARAALAEAAKARKAIEKLRDNRLEQWRLAESKKEADALDEAGMQLSYYHNVEPQVTTP